MRRTPPDRKRKARSERLDHWPEDADAIHGKLVARGVLITPEYWDPMADPVDLDVLDEILATDLAPKFG